MTQTEQVTVQTLHCTPSPVFCIHSMWLHLSWGLVQHLADWEIYWKVCARFGCEASASVTAHFSVSLWLSAGKSHRRDAADSLQQAPLMAITASDEEDVKHSWCSQVLWVEKNWPAVTLETWLRTSRCSHRGNICCMPTPRADAIVLAHKNRKKAGTRFT